MKALGKEMSPEETLAHYGVLGMKWGRTRARATAGEIREARSRVNAQRGKLLSKEVAAIKASPGQEKKKAVVDANRMRARYLKNPDRVTAARMTRGEKAVFALLVPGGLAAIAGTSAASRRIEYKQDRKMYNKP